MALLNHGATLTGKDGKVFYVLPGDAEAALDADFTEDFTGPGDVVYTVSKPGDDASVIIEDGAAEGSGMRVSIAVKEAKPTRSASSATTTKASDA